MTEKHRVSQFYAPEMGEKIEIGLLAILVSMVLTGTFLSIFQLEKTTKLGGTGSPFRFSGLLGWTNWSTKDPEKPVDSCLLQRPSRGWGEP